MFCNMLAHVSMRHHFKSLLLQMGILCKHSCINPQIQKSTGLRSSTALDRSNVAFLIEGAGMVWYGMVWYGIVEFNVPLDTV